MKNTTKKLSNIPGYEGVKSNPDFPWAAIPLAITADTLSTVKKNPATIKETKEIAL